MRRKWLGVTLLCGVAACGPRAAESSVGFIDAPVAAVAVAVAGQVADVSVRAGDRVKKGDLLARLDPRERAAAVAQAEANVTLAREALREAEQSAAAALPSVRAAGADVERESAQLVDAEAAFERVQRLVPQGGATLAELDTARARRDAARAQVQGLSASKQISRAKVAVANAGVGTAQAALASAQASLELSRVLLSEAEVRSPFDGIVAERNLEPGEWAAPGTAVVSVEDSTRQWVRVDVEETDLSRLRVGDSVAVRVVAFPAKRFSARVVEIGAEAEFALNRDVKRGRADVRTFRVRAELTPTAPELRPGMTAEVALSAAASAP